MRRIQLTSRKRAPTRTRADSTRVETALDLEAPLVGHRGAAVSRIRDDQLQIGTSRRLYGWDHVSPRVPVIKVHEIAAQLQIYEARLALDDFGEGYSSLACLRDLPFQELKIDRSFVPGCAVEPAKRDLCQTIVDMAHRSDCTVVAEGIETKADLNVVKATGCEYGQGYLLGRPMRKGDLIQRLQEGSP